MCLLIGDCFGFFSSLYSLFNIIYSCTSYVLACPQSAELWQLEWLLSMERFRLSAFRTLAVECCGCWDPSVFCCCCCCCMVVHVCLLCRAVSSSTCDVQLAEGTTARSWEDLLRAALATVRDRNLLLTRVVLGLFLSHRAHRSFVTRGQKCQDFTLVGGNRRRRENRGAEDAERDGPSTHFWHIWGPQNTSGRENSPNKAGFSVKNALNRRLEEGGHGPSSEYISVTKKR